MYCACIMIEYVSNNDSYMSRFIKWNTNALPCELPKQTCCTIVLARMKGYDGYDDKDYDMILYDNIMII